MRPKQPHLLPWTRRQVCERFLAAYRDLPVPRRPVVLDYWQQHYFDGTSLLGELSTDESACILLLLIVAVGSDGELVRADCLSSACYSMESADQIWRNAAGTSRAALPTWVGDQMGWSAEALIAAGRFEQQA